jgi:hypothetical protein
MTLRLAVYRQSVRLGAKPLETHGQHFFFQLNTYGYSPYVASCLTRGCVCSLQLLLVLASAVILRSDSRGTHDHILLSQIRGSQPGGPGPRIYNPQEQDGPVTPPALGSLFVASYDSQGYGGVRPRLHAGVQTCIKVYLFP